MEWGCSGRLGLWLGWGTGWNPVLLGGAELGVGRGRPFIADGHRSAIE